MVPEGLKDILSHLNSLRLQTAKIQDQVVADLQINSGDPRAGGFGMIYKHVLYAQECLSYYFSIWDKLQPQQASPGDVRTATGENGERVMALLRQLFVASMSSIEYCAKRTLDLYPKSQTFTLVYKGNPKRIYLMKIMNASKSASLLGEQDRLSWDGLVEIRNMVVHNNGISDKDESLQIGSSNVDLKSGGMTKGKPNFFVVLSEEATGLFEKWVGAMAKSETKP